jgi:sugar phosphate isomerase/epimerase
VYPSIFSNVIEGAGPEEVAARTRQLGLGSVQFFPPGAEVGFGFDGDVAHADFATWARAYAADDVEVCGIAGYINLLHPDLARRRSNIEAFKGWIRELRTFGCRFISTETGTLATSGDWDDHPDNRSPAAWDAFRRVAEELVAVAAEEDAVILFEPYIVNVCHTPELAARLVREVGSPHLALLMDPTNWFDNESARPERVAAVIDAGFEAERGLFRLAHAKDVTPPEPGSPKPGLPGPGQGLLDYPRYLSRLAEHGYDGPLVIEHLTEAEVPQALRFVQGQIDALTSASAGD